MALINCPNCSKRISDVLSMCPECGFVRGEVDDDAMAEFNRRKMRDRVYHLKMTNYAVISVFLAAFGWYWWDTAGFQQAASAWPIALLVVTGFAYLVMRALLFMARKKLGRMNRPG